MLELQLVGVLVTDLRMPGMDGMGLLAEVSARWPEVPVVMLTGHGTVALAVRAMQAGAVDFLLKPFERDDILFVVEKALARAQPAQLERAAPAPQSAPKLLGTSAVMAELLGLIRKAAVGMANVLVRGESGTGKELVARALHELGPRRACPLVSVHCAALPEALLESELFGYEKGAFTGASTRKPGRVELAEGGTLFLDEIGDLPAAVQVKLLRLLQEKQYEPLGGTRTVRADVRFVAATHQPLEEKVRRGEFREDLFYRLNVVPLQVPALRVRPDDIPPLVQYFIQRCGEQNAKPGATLDASGTALLRAQPWPGNVRQLQNFIERLVVLSDGVALTEADVTRELARESAQGQLFQEPTPVGNAELGLDAQRRAMERGALEKALASARNNRTLAARLLGVSRRTLYNKLEEHGLGRS